MSATGTLPPAETPPRRSWTLRARLVLALVAVTAVVSLTVGGISVLVLDRFLVGRLDDQLTAAVERSTVGRDGPPGRPGGRGPQGEGFGFLLQPGQAEGTLGAEVQGGVVTLAAVLDETGTPRPLDPGTTAGLVQVAPEEPPTTVDLPVGRYRVLAVTTADGSTLVTGLPLDEVQDTSWSLLLITVTTTAVGCLVVVLAGGAVVRRALRPLRELTGTATRVRGLDLATGAGALAERVPDRIASTPDEVGEVASALNLMLDHVEQALSERHRSETQVRRFVADASHELRTPLASIRGYAELVRRRPDPLPADVAMALGRVESEAGRMGGLVDDLLLLARLDAGRPLEAVPVDLVPVLVAALADAHAAGPEHHWVLELAGDDPVVVTGEEARLHQVVVNLLANARVHTPPGSQVGLRLAVEGAEAVVTVADDGPGVPEDVRERVFERFSRADGSRSRAGGSTGLGLSIVAAVVEAHGGTVACPPVAFGATFVVRLSLAPEADSEPRSEPGSGQAAGG